LYFFYVEGEEAKRYQEQYDPSGVGSEGLPLFHAAVQALHGRVEGLQPLGYLRGDLLVLSDYLGVLYDLAADLEHLVGRRPPPVGGDPVVDPDGGAHAGVDQLVDRVERRVVQPLAPQRRGGELHRGLFHGDVGDGDRGLRTVADEVDEAFGILLGGLEIRVEAHAALGELVVRSVEEGGGHAALHDLRDLPFGLLEERRPPVERLHGLA